MNNPVNIFRNMMNLGTNPQQIEQILYSRNPRLRAISNQIKESGMTPIEFAMQYAKQNNIPLQHNSVLNYYEQMLDMTK